MSGKWQQATRFSGLDHAPQRMAEPMHRIPPPGVTSMASLRDVPKSCIQKVKDICLFYVEKCSGEYINNRTAARYVHHMADEIISQLSGVADEIKRNRTDPEMFQALIDEWNAYFPKTLHNLGSPKQVALLLKQQETTILQLQDELAKVKAKRTGDVEDLLKSMDNQLQSYKHSVLLERNHLKTQIDGVIANYTTQLEECKKYFEEDKAALIKQYEKMLADLQERYDEEKSGNEQQFRQKHDAIFRKLDYVQTLSRKKIDLMKEKNEFYKEKYTKLCKKYKLLVNSIAINKKELQEINDEIDEDLLAVSDDSNNALDTDDLSSLEALDFDAQATGTTAATSSSSGSFGVSSGGRASAGYGAALQTPTQSATGGLQNTSSHSQSPSAVGTGSRRRSSIVRDIAASYSEEKKEKLRLEEANLFANAQIQALQTNVADAEKKHKKYEAKIAVLQREIEALNNERSIHLKRLEELEDLVHSLQKALATKLSAEKETYLQGISRSGSSVALEPEEKDHLVLCHTPHFLDRPDREGPLRGHQTVTGYYHSGYF